jgi:polyferredoxin
MTTDPMTGASSWNEEGPGDERARAARVGDPGPATSFLWTAAATVVTGLVLVVVPSLAAHIAGYLLCSIVTVTLVAMFRRKSHERLFAGVAPPRSENRVAVALLVVGLVGAGLNAWSIAAHFTHISPLV